MKVGRGGEEGEGKGWKGRGRQMEGPTYKGRRGGEGKREREGPPGYYGFLPGSRGARIVTGLKPSSSSSRGNAGNLALLKTSFTLHKFMVEESDYIQAKSRTRCRKHNIR